MKVAVVGTGHVGLVTCATLAAVDHEVVGTDSDLEKLEALRSGRTPFHEPGLNELVASGLERGNLRFTGDMSDAVPGAECVLLCVGTPPRVTGEANLAAVEKAGREIVRNADGGGLLLIEKSTVPAGTAVRLQRALAAERPEMADKIEVASNPEFLREGHAVEDSMRPPRILVGADSEVALEKLRRLYAPFVSEYTVLVETSTATAELAKHASNAFLALKISFANALAQMSELSGADVLEVVDVMGLDPRIGREMLSPGIGYGGSCFPKDLIAFAKLAERLGYQFPFLDDVARVNEEAQQHALEKIRDAVWNLDGKKIALLGLAFKAGTDDIRFSPALSLARGLQREGAQVTAYDPQAGANAKSELPDIEIATDAYEAAVRADCLVIATDWPEFRGLDPSRLGQVMAQRVVVDGRNLLDPEVFQAAGFTYYGIGRTTPKQ